MRISNLLPDNRLKERGALLMSRMVEKRSCIIRQISMNWKEEMGFWRYLKNPRVSLDWLIESSLAPIKAGESIKGRHLLIWYHYNDCNSLIINNLPLISFAKGYVKS